MNNYKNKKWNGLGKLSRDPKSNNNINPIINHMPKIQYNKSCSKNPIMITQYILKEMNDISDIYTVYIYMLP